MLDEMCGENINVELVGVDIREFGADGGEAFVPKGHRVDDAVGFRSRSDVLAARARELEGVTQDAVAAVARENRFLQRKFFAGAMENATAHFGVFAFRILADDAEID